MFSHESGEVQSCNFYRLYKTRIGGLSFIDNIQFIIWFLHKQNWAASTNRNFIVTYSCLDKKSSVKRCLLFGWNSNLQLLLFFNLAVESIDSGEILASVWQEDENFEALKRCYIQIYPTSVLLCYEKAVILCKTYSGVMWSSCRRNSGTQLIQSISDTQREITNLSYFTQTGATYDENTEVKFEQTWMYWDVGQKHQTFREFPRASSAKILAACTSVCRRWWRNLF